jgi:uncharacterized protein YbjQ (UPF0145 family)
MLVVSTDTIPGRKITQVMGVIFGYSKTPGFFQSLKSSHEELILKDIKKNAEACGANAIVGFRCMVGGSGNITMISGYGTAVVVEDGE